MGSGGPGYCVLPVRGVTPDQDGAVVEIPEMKFVGISPTNIVLRRSEKAVTVAISKPGYLPQQYRVEMKIDGIGVAGLIGDGLLAIPFWIASAGAFTGDLTRSAQRDSSMSEIIFALARDPNFQASRVQIPSSGISSFMGKDPGAQEPEFRPVIYPDSMGSSTNSTPEPISKTVLNPRAYRQSGGGTLKVIR